MAIQAKSRRRRGMDGISQSFFILGVLSGIIAFFFGTAAILAFFLESPGLEITAYFSYAGRAAVVCLGGFSAALLCSLLA